MRILSKIIAALGAVGISISGHSAPAVASESDLTCEQVSDGILGLSRAELNKQAECACEDALEEDTIEALEGFLEKYWWADTACKALALEQLQTFSPDGPGVYTNEQNDGYPG